MCPIPAPKVELHRRPNVAYELRISNRNTIIIGGCPNGGGALYRDVSLEVRILDGEISIGIHSRRSEVLLVGSAHMEGAQIKCTYDKTCRGGEGSEVTFDRGFVGDSPCCLAPIRVQFDGELMKYHSPRLTNLIGFVSLRRHSWGTHLSNPARQMYCFASVIRPFSSHQYVCHFTVHIRQQHLDCLDTVVRGSRCCDECLGVDDSANTIAGLFRRDSSAA